jgi:coproporphyrinogen III oxidase-like Fe-S oxidoreductase
VDEASAAGAGSTAGAGDDLGVRVTNPPIKAWLRGDPPERQRLEPRDLVLERLMTGLRTRRGVDLGELETRSGIRVQERYGQVVTEELAAGRLELEARLSADGGGSGDDRGPVLRATPDGLLLLDAVLRRFFAA